jgi:hypothetical protein
VFYIKALGLYRDCPNFSKLRSWAIMSYLMEYQYIAIGSAALSVILGIALAWLWMRVQRIDRVRKQFMMEDENKTVDDVLVNHDQLLKRLGSRVEEVGEHSSGLAIANKKNFQKVGFVRFNPFGDAGGSISFVLALLDAENNGFVISSLHGRDGNRTYAKEVKKGDSKSQLTEEEKQAIKEAA